MASRELLLRFWSEAKNSLQDMNGGEDEGGNVDKAEQEAHKTSTTLSAPGLPKTSLGIPWETVQV